MPVSWHSLWTDLGSRPRPCPPPVPVRTRVPYNLGAWHVLFSLFQKDPPPPHHHPFSLSPSLCLAPDFYSTHQEPHTRPHWALQATGPPSPAFSHSVISDSVKNLLRLPGRLDCSSKRERRWFVLEIPRHKRGVFNRGDRVEVVDADANAGHAKACAVSRVPDDDDTDAGQVPH